MYKKRKIWKKKKEWKGREDKIKSLRAAIRLECKYSQNLWFIYIHRSITFDSPLMRKSKCVD